jgi:uncharacterized protein with HEPN domain
VIKDDSLYLAHILISISKILTYSSGKEYADFINNELIQDAIIRHIEIIGEASGKVSDETKMKYSFIPWTDIKGMRNKLIHDYFGVDVDEVWKVIQKDIPLLKIQIRKILEETNPQILLNLK